MYCCRLYLGLSVLCSLPMKPSDRTKVNTRYMPTLSNGYIGATVGDSALYLNGLYEGIGGRGAAQNISIFERYDLSV